MQKNIVKKSLVFVVIALFIDVAIAPSTANVADINISTNNKLPSIPSVSGKTIYVDDDNTQGPWDGTIEHPYRFIQDGVDNASDGDTVFVFNGIYSERVEVYTSINLIGENVNETIVDAGFSSCPIWIGADNVTVSGFTTQNSGNTEYNDAGIHIGWYEHGTLRNCKVIGNKMINNFDGFFTLFPEKHNIEENIIMNNRHCGIFLQGGSAPAEVKIANNLIIDNSGCGIYDDNGPTANIISGNTIVNSGECGIYLTSDVNRVFKNRIINHTYGMYLTSYNHVYLNSIEDNEYGISCDFLNIIEKNNFIKNGCDATYISSFMIRNRWNRNYWDDNLKLRPKVIEGIVYPIVLNVLYELWFFIHDKPVPPLKGITTHQYDWHPALKPYDITTSNVETGEEYAECFN